VCLYCKEGFWGAHCFNDCSQSCESGCHQIYRMYIMHSWKVG
jgi:hypothetical protein